MTKPKTDPKTRGMNVERTFFNLADRWRSGEDSAEKRDALYSAATMVAGVLLQRHWRAAELYRCAIALTSPDEELRRVAVARALEVIAARVPELSERVALRALLIGVTHTLRTAGFSVPEIAELVDDGREGTTAQRRGRVKPRLAKDATKAFREYSKTMLVKDNSGTPI